MFVCCDSALLLPLDRGRSCKWRILQGSDRRLSVSLSTCPPSLSFATTVVVEFLLPFSPSILLLSLHQFFLSTSFCMLDSDLLCSSLHSFLLGFFSSSMCPLGADFLLSMNISCSAPCGSLLLFLSCKSYQLFLNLETNFRQILKEYMHRPNQQLANLPVDGDEWVWTPCESFVPGEGLWRSDDKIWSSDGVFSPAKKKKNDIILGPTVNNQVKVGVRRFGCKSWVLSESLCLSVSVTLCVNHAPCLWYKWRSRVL